MGLGTSGSHDPLPAKVLWGHGCVVLEIEHRSDNMKVPVGFRLGLPGSGWPIYNRLCSDTPKGHDPYTSTLANIHHKYIWIHLGYMKTFHWYTKWPTGLRWLTIGAVWGTYMGTSAWPKFELYLTIRPDYQCVVHLNGEHWVIGPLQGSSEGPEGASHNGQGACFLKPRPTGASVAFLAYTSWFGVLQRSTQHPRSLSMSTLW